MTATCVKEDARCSDLTGIEKESDDRGNIYISIELPVTDIPGDFLNFELAFEREDYYNLAAVVRLSEAGLIKEVTLSCLHEKVGGNCSSLFYLKQ